MTYQPPPPPPPPAGPPPSGPPGAWGRPPGAPGSQPAFNPANVNPLDWGILGAGVLAFIFSLFDYYTVSVHGFGSDSESAWHGFFGWFGALLAIVGAALVAIQLFAPHVKLPWPNRLLGLGVFALAFISTLIALFVFPVDVPSGLGIDTGRGFGYWASLIVILAGLVLSLMRFQQTGGQLPGALGKIPDIGQHGPQGGIGGPAAPPQGPPPGYGPPAGPPPGYGPPAGPPPSAGPPPGYAPPPPPQQ